MFKSRPSETDERGEWRNERSLIVGSTFFWRAPTQNKSKGFKNEYLSKIASLENDKKRLELQSLPNSKSEGSSWPNRNLI